LIVKIARINRIAAVIRLNAYTLAKWVYTLNEKGIAVRVTQRLEFDWMNYKENIKEAINKNAKAK
jgi:hypothetical protein